MQLIPYRVSTLSPILAAPSGGVRLPKVFGPYNDVPLTGPVVKRGVQLRLGSTLGLSLPLSGFLAQPEVCGLISYRNRSWDPPSECSPRKDRAPLSGPPCSSAVIHLRAVAHRLRRIIDRFANVHAFARLLGVPGRL